MELVIPDGAQVHITIGQPPVPALQHDTGPIALLPEQPRGRIAKGLLAGALLFGAFQAGRFLPHHAGTADAAQPQAASAGSGLTGYSNTGEIPPAFRAQIARRPQVLPPPGAAPVAAPDGPTSGAPTQAPAPAPANPFGLQG